LGTAGSICGSCHVQSVIVFLDKEKG
jgi:hypothetical protein